MVDSLWTRNTALGIALGVGVSTFFAAVGYGWLHRSPVRLQSDSNSSPTAQLPDMEELKNEQFSRHRQFFGEGQSKIECSTVVIVGIGGVGSHAANMLARGGIGRLRLIDVDNVSLSSLNRHAFATRDDVGTPKVVATSRAIARIAPSCKVDALHSLCTAESVAELVMPGGSRPDYVLDCIDDKFTKCALLEFCLHHGLRVLSSLGAGGKADPTRVHVADMALVRQDPLGVAIRLHLRKVGAILKAGPTLEQTTRRMHSGEGGGEMGGEGGDTPMETPTGTVGEVAPPAEPVRPKRKPRRNPKGRYAQRTIPLPPGAVQTADDGEGIAVPLSGIMCVYSSERARASLLPFPDMDPSKGDTAQDFGSIPGFRVRVLPVLGTMPALFGQAMAAVVLTTLAGVPTEARSDTVLTTGVAGRLQGRGLKWESQYYGRGPAWGGFGGMSLDEVDASAVGLWHLRSPVGGARHGVKSVALVPCRWRPWAGPGVANIVLLTVDEAEAITGAVCTSNLLQLAQAAAQGPMNGRATARQELESGFRAAMLLALEDIGSPDPDATFQRIEDRLLLAKREGWD